MAAKRVSKSALDWAKFASLVPSEEAALFQTLKGKVDANVTRVQGLPESLPSINFAAYKSAVPVYASAIDAFAKSYAAVTVPYPKDGGKVAEIDAALKDQVANNDEWIKESAARVTGYKAELAKWEVVPPLEHMMEEEWNYYFPGTYLDSKIEAHYMETANPDEDDPRLFEYQRDYDVRLAPWQEEDH